MLNKRALRKCPQTSHSKKVAELFNAVDDLDVVLELTVKNYNQKRLCLVDISYKNKPFGRMFIHRSKDDYEFITLIYATNSWRKSNLFSLNVEGYRPLDYCSYAVIFEDTKKVQNYFDINEYQNNHGIVRKIDFILRESKESARNKIAEKKDSECQSLFKKLPPLNKSQIEFCSSDAVLFSQKYPLGFFDFKKRTIYCTKCKKNHTVDESFVYKKGGQTICPHCKETIFIYSTLCSPSITCTPYIFSRVGSTPILRHFRVTRKYAKGGKEYTVNITEFGRDIIMDRKLVKYSNTNGFWEKGRKNDFDTFYHTSPYQNGCLYRGNLKQVFKNTCLEYCGLSLYPQYTIYKWDWYLRTYFYYPQLEFLLKANLFTLIEEIVNSKENLLRHSYFPYSVLDKVYPKAHTLGDFLGCNKNILKKLNENSTFEDIAFLKYLDSLDESLNVKEFFENTLKEFKNNATTFANISANAIDTVNKLMQSARAVNLSTNKLIKYLSAQKQLNSMRYENFKDIVNDYYDYITCCKELNYDVNHKRVNQPADLANNHDEAFEFKKAVENATLNNNYKLFYSEVLQHLNNNIDGLQFILPESEKDFIKQGKELHQCVGRGSYYQNTAERKEIIVCIYKDDVPYLTLEFKNGKNIQLRGMSNHSPSDQDRVTVDKYVDFVNHMCFTNENGKITLLPNIEKKLKRQSA